MTLCFAPFKAVAFDPLLGLPILIAWVVVGAINRLMAVPAALLAFAGVVVFGVDIADEKLASLASLKILQLELVMPDIEQAVVIIKVCNFILVVAFCTYVLSLLMSLKISLAGRLGEEYRIAIRVCDNYDGLDESFFRVAVKSGEDNQKLVEALSGEFGRPISFPVRKKTPAIMFQGCSSSAGKSFLATALCRVLWQDGLEVAPFKSQNMSLNSFVTYDGGEMGRAQVVQAQACKLDPDVRMNPVLLKPNSDTGSQVIVLGKPVGNMKVSEYTSYKSKLFETVKESYDSLCEDYEVVVLEGAGSPAEINLKSER